MSSSVGLLFCSQMLELNVLFPSGRYPSLRVAYIDEVEQTHKDSYKGADDKIYYSALVKAAPQTKPMDSSESVQTLDQV